MSTPDYWKLFNHYKESKHPSDLCYCLNLILRKEVVGNVEQAQKYRNLIFKDLEGNPKEHPNKLLEKAIINLLENVTKQP